jgi:ribosomal protein S18 acetylase RimI-like enzyme
MPLVLLHSKLQIEAALRRETALHLYEIGDLDDFFFEYTTWYGLKDGAKVRQVALLYAAPGLPVLLALSETQQEDLARLLAEIRPLLPRRLYLHLTPAVAPILEQDYSLESHGLHYKMLLRDPARLDNFDTSEVTQLLPDDQAEIERLYAAAYPGNWFDPRMLETGCYYGIRQDQQLVCVAGIHVYSEQYKIATLGNVTTHPDYRGRQLATLTCARLSKALLEKVEYVGLNVKADNRAAIATYQKLGFEISATYEEFEARLRRDIL